MRVTFFTKRYWPAVGGVEQHLAGLIPALRQQLPGLELTVVTELHDPQLPVYEVVDGVSLWRVPGSELTNEREKKKLIWDWLWRHRKLLTQADLIHVHDVFFWLWPLLPSLWRQPIYTTFHGYEPPGPPTWKQLGWHQLAALLSDGTLGIGSFHQRWYQVQPDLISYGAISTPPQISQQQTLPTAALELPAAPSPAGRPRQLVFVGRLAEDTGIWLFLEALAAGQRSTAFPRYHLTMVGDGPERLAVTEFIRQAQLPVTLVGAQAEPQPYLEQAEVVLATGYLSMLAGLAAGRPVVASYGTALKRDYLVASPFAGHVTILPPGQPLQAGLATVIRQPATASATTMAWVRQQSWAKLATQYLQLWGQR